MRDQAILNPMRGMYGAGLRSVASMPTDRRWFMLALVGLSIAVFVLNRGHQIEQGVYLDQLVPYAEHIAGDGERELLSYPMWGYPFLMFLLGSAGLVLLQYVLAVGAFAVTYVVFLARLTSNSWGRAMLVFMSVPWFAYMSVKWPGAVAVPLAWIAVSLFTLGVKRDFDLKLMVPAGAIIGLAANFRSEMLILGMFMAVLVPVWQVRSFGLWSKRSPGMYLRLVMFPTILVVLLIPWAGFQYARTGHFLLTSSNSGAVSVITLGQLPGNPWGIEHNDSEPSRIMRGLGFSKVDPLSPTGSKILRAYFLRAIGDHPLAFGKKVTRNTINMFLGGFYIGDWELLLPAENQQQTEILKERMKLALGLSPNLEEIQAYIDKGTWDTSLRISPGLVILAFAMAYLMVSNIVILVSVVAGAWKAAKGHLDVETKVLLVFLLFGLTMAALLQYQPRHMNVAIPAMLAILVPIIEQSNKVRPLVERSIQALRQ